MVNASVPRSSRKRLFHRLTLVLGRCIRIVGLFLVFKPPFQPSLIADVKVEHFVAEIDSRIGPDLRSSVRIAYEKLQNAIKSGRMVYDVPFERQLEALDHFCEAWSNGEHVVICDP